MTKLSFSKISTFLECPRKYWYLYELKLKKPKSEGFYFGIAIHEGLENYYLGKDPMQGVSQALFGKKKDVGEQPEESIDLDKLYKEAKRIFQMYPEQAPYFDPTLIEHFFEVPIIHPESQEKLPATLRGKIDLITTNPDVVDHKTASGSDTGFFEDTNKLQVNAYSYAHFQLFKKLPKRFIFNFIIKGNTKREPRMEHKIYKPQLGDICNFFDTCKYVLGAIERGETEHYPSKIHYRVCPFKDICSYCQKRNK